jgi:hypothetical protein
MRKLTIILVAAATVAMITHSVTRSEHAPATVASQGMMPSPFQMMFDARDLQATPFVAP